MRHRAFVAILGLSAWSVLAFAGNASSGSSGSSSHPATTLVGGAAHTLSGGATHDTATARSILGSNFSFQVTRQSLMGHAVELTSFSSPRPLTGPERRQLNHAGYVVTKVTQGNGDLVYYCRRSPDITNSLDCFGPERGH
jgi:hypothetical protein